MAFRTRWLRANIAGFGLGFLVYVPIAHGVTGSHGFDLTLPQLAAHSTRARRCRDDRGHLPAPRAPGRRHGSRVAGISGRDRLRRRLLDRVLHPVRRTRSRYGTRVPRARCRRYGCCLTDSESEAYFGTSRGRRSVGRCRLEGACSRQCHGLVHHRATGLLARSARGAHLRHRTGFRHDDRNDDVDGLTAQIGLGRPEVRTIDEGRGDDGRLGRRLSRRGACR